MASRTLWSRIVEAHEENQDLPAGERNAPTSPEEPVELGSVGEAPEPSENVTSPLDEGQARETSEMIVLPSEQAPPDSSDTTMRLQQMLQDFFQSIKSDLNSVKSDLRADLNSHQANFEQFQSNIKLDLAIVKSDLQSNQTRLDQFQNSVKSDLKSDLNKVKAEVRSELNQVKSDLQAHQEQVRTDILSENQKLLRNFEAQTQGLRKEFNSKLESETWQVSQLVTQVQSETTAEFIAVKRQLQGLSTEFDARLDTTNANTQGLINELVDQMLGHQSEVLMQMERQKESLEKLTESQLDQIKAKFVEIKDRLQETADKQTSATEAIGTMHHSPPPSAGPTDGPVRTEVIEMSSGLVDGTASCIHQPTTCHTVASNNSSMNEVNVHANPSAKVLLSSYLTNSELPIPLYDDALEINPVSHLRLLEEFFQFCNVPKSLCGDSVRSIIGHLSKQWMEAIAHRLTDYEAFKEAFLNTWWSSPNSH
jgi:hypothetical protein